MRTARKTSALCVHSVSNRQCSTHQIYSRFYAETEGTRSHRRSEAVIQPPLCPGVRDTHLVPDDANVKNSRYWMTSHRVTPHPHGWAHTPSPHARAVPSTGLWPAGPMGGSCGHLAAPQGARAHTLGCDAPSKGTSLKGLVHFSILENNTDTEAFLPPRPLRVPALFPNCVFTRRSGSPDPSPRLGRVEPGSAGGPEGP